MKLSTSEAIEALIKIAADRYEKPVISISVDPVTDFQMDRTIFRIVVENEALEQYARKDAKD